MKICVYAGRSQFLEPIVLSLEKKGHQITFNKFNRENDLVIVQDHSQMYEVYKNLNQIKKYKIRLINIVLDIPPWRLNSEFYQNNVINSLRQMIFAATHKNKYLNEKFHRIRLKNRNTILKKILDTEFRNRVYYQINYHNFLKKSDLNLSISKFTQSLVKKFLKIDSKVWYPGVNSDLLLSLPKPEETIYDVINISRITPTKCQKIIVEASKRLNLNALIIGKHQDKSINLDCPHMEIKEHSAILKELNKAYLYVDASIFEGFGLTPIEAAFLNKITIASDTVVHREILQDYPLYFKKNDVRDLMNKMKLVLDNTFTLDKSIIKKIKKEYSLEAARNRLLGAIEEIL